MGSCVQMHSLAETHRIGRVLSFFSSRRNWDSPTPHPQASMPPPLWFRGGGEHSLAGKGWGRPNSDEGTYTVVLFIYTYFVLRPLNSPLTPHLGLYTRALLVSQDKRHLLEPPGFRHVWYLQILHAFRFENDYLTLAHSDLLILRTGPYKS